MKIVILVLGLALGAVQVWAQCANGDILWVSDAVNANVGTAAGGGGTGARCAASTVAGAAYNSTASPFGAQAALDCACPGATIRYLAGANNYDSTSASWNNRLDATKELQFTTLSTDGANGQIPVEGWLDAATKCESFQQAGCPIVMDFTGGTDDGFDWGLGGSGGRGGSFMGIHVTGAADDCFNGNNQPQSAYAVVEFSNCGGIGFLSASSANSSGVLMYGHDNGEDGLNPRGGFSFLEAHDNGVSGVISGSANGAQIERVVSYDNVPPYGNSGSDHDLLSYATLVGGSTTSGWDGGSGNKQGAGALNIISQQNDRYGLEDYVSGQEVPMTYYGCLALANNTLGTTFNPVTVNDALLRGTIDSTSVAVFAGGGSYNVSGVGTCSYTFEGSDTTIASCPGASPTCVLGAGLFIQSVR